ncbi:MAG: GNAT family protein [Rhizomicrobium sp.]
MVRLRPATPDDIPFILATERGEGYEALVGRFEEAEHRANLADSNWLYLIGLDAAGAAQGFAILQDRDSGDGSEFLRRIAVVNAGQGFGRRFLAAVIDWAFANTTAQRFRLHVRKVNVRARHVYASLGFVEVAEEAGGDSDSVSMSLARSAWVER